MSSFQMVFSPPARKPTLQKLEKVEEAIPELILLPFSPTPEIKFGQVLLNSVASKTLSIWNKSSSFIEIKFSNIDADDRISVIEDKIPLHTGDRIKVSISWRPIHSGYLRKVIRVQDARIKARSFDVVLSGMAVNKAAENSKKKKSKTEAKKSTGYCAKPGFDSTITLTQSTNQQVMHDLRRQTYIIEEKENRLPIDYSVPKKTFKASSPKNEFSNLNVLHENSAMTNFSRNSFASYDTVDAPTKYSNFESELDSSNLLSSNLSGEMNPMVIRRSTFSMDFKAEPEEQVIFSPPQNDVFSDSLEEESPVRENVTFDLKSGDQHSEENVFLTPRKHFSLESLLMSPPQIRDAVPSSVSKSTNCLSSIGESFGTNYSFKSCQKDELLFISPPNKSYKLSRKSPERFVHRTESSAIKDRRKHLRTSFMSRRRTPPGSTKKLPGHGRFSAFMIENSVEKIRTHNPRVLKQVVSSQCHIEDPFLKQVLYNDDEWMDQQEKEIIKWMNSVLVPPVELDEENANWTVDAAEAWLSRNRSGDSAMVWSVNKVPVSLYNAPEKVALLRKRSKALLESDLVSSVFHDLRVSVSKNTIFVRDGRDICADEGIKSKLLQLLACYNPLWLRVGLEAVYGKEVALQPRADIGGLGVFIRKTVLVNCNINKKTASQKEEIRKTILLKFFQLIFFMDQARVQRLFRHNRCLFTLNSQYKSSQDLLSAFIRDLVTCRVYIGKHLKSIGYTLQFKQTCIDEYDYTITSLKDLNDGVRLTRLFEILFSEPDLCSRLRVPAVDIENKKHNVDVAMRAAKKRCVIEGKITAEDFVLASRVGSRIKILSFLWQVINNYLTPLYEKAAITIQQWWRACFSKIKAGRLKVRKREHSAVVIQSIWRGYVMRKRFAETLCDMKKRNAAAVLIQRRYRACKKTKECRDRFVKLRKYAIVIQQRYRAKVAARTERNRFTLLRRAAITIQRWYRRTKLMREYRDRFRRLRECSIFIQRRYRANAAMRIERNRYVSLRQAVITVKQTYRSMKLMRKCRNRFEELKKYSTLVQRRFRANAAMRVQRNRYMSLRHAAITVQRRYRCMKLMLDCRDRFQQLKRCSIFIQRRYRAIVAMRMERNQFTSLRQAAVTVQRRYRAVKLMRECRDQFQTLKRCSIFIQRRYRANVAMLIQRDRFTSLKQAAITIQQKYRGTKLMRQCRGQFERLKQSAICIQRGYRANMAMRAERSRFVRLKQATIIVQRRYRSIRLMRECRDRFELLRRCSIFIQRRFRANVAMRAQRNRFTTLRQVAITVQRWYRSTKLMIECRHQFQELRRSSIIIQQRYRANVASRIQRNRFLSLRQAVITIQRRYRGTKLMRECRDRFERLHRCSILIQRRYRANGAMRAARNQFISLRQATIAIQRWYRSIKLTKECRDRFLELKRCSIIIQRRYQATVAMWVQRERFTRIRLSAITVQRIYRGNKLTKEYRDRFERLKRCSILVQRRYRANVAMRDQRNRFVSLRQAAVTIQRRYRANKLMSVHRERFEALKICSIFIQQQYRANVSARRDRREFLSLRRAAITIQRRYRSMKLANECCDRFARLKRCSIFVQRRYRANVAMRIDRRRFTCLREAAVVVQRRYRALRMMRTCRASYLALRTSTVFVQQRWRANMARSRFLRTRAAVIQIQKWWRATQSRRRVLRLASLKNTAATKIQALWRGYITRKKCILPKNVPSLASKKEKENSSSKSTLGERYRKAIYDLKTSDLYSVVTISLWNLETVTTFSAKLCEGVVAEGIAPIIFNLIARGNRSVPALVLYRASIGILINLTLYEPTKVVLWENMNKIDDVLLVLHLMKITHNQFGRKDDVDVFRYSVTFLWLLCQDASIAESIANIPNVYQQLEKMKSTLLRTCPCTKKLDTKRVARTLPNTQAKWYADTKTRTFNDNCFALSSLFRILYSR